MSDSSSSKPVLNTHGEAEHPSHSLPGNTELSAQAADKASTASHPHETKPDPTTSETKRLFHPPTGKQGPDRKNAERGESAAVAAGAAKQPGAQTSLPHLVTSLKAALRQYPDFPSPGILFEDIMPIFADSTTFSTLITALELLVAANLPKDKKVDVVVGLESRGFLFGPTLALKLKAGFVPVRKAGKLPGKTITESYKKEYGTDDFQMQEDAIKKGQTVLVVDDIIATGGSAAASGALVRKLGGDLLGYVFMMELDFLKGRDKLDAPVWTLLTGQEEGLEKSSEEKAFPMGMTKESAGDNKSVTDTGGAAAGERP